MLVISKTVNKYLGEIYSMLILWSTVLVKFVKLMIIELIMFFSDILEAYLCKFQNFIKQKGKKRSNLPINYILTKYWIVLNYLHK
jgi:hypothetical protein